MKVNDTIISSSKLDVREALLLLLISKIEDESEIEAIKESLKDKNLINGTTLELTDKGRRKLSIFEGITPINYNDLARKLQEIYPKGRKLGTNCMWRDSTAIIARKLKTLVDKYGCAFSEEKAIQTTKDYVDSFNGDYTYMQVLKYFLLKSTTYEGDREIKSEFMSRLENYDPESDVSDNWNTELV